MKTYDLLYVHNPEDLGLYEQNADYWVVSNCLYNIHKFVGDSWKYGHSKREYKQFVGLVTLSNKVLSKYHTEVRYNSI